MMKRLLTLLLLFMSFTMDSLADVAPGPWHEPIVSADIVSKVMVHPIAHSSVVRIPALESGEPLVDLLVVNEPRLVPMSSIDKNYKNTYEGWSKVRRGVYERLMNMLAILPKNIGIAYFEGFRTLSKQKEYFDNKFLEILQSMPDVHAAYAETTKHVSPFIDNIPTHATGAAIDMTLFVVNQGEKSLLDLGMFDVIYGPNNQQETFSTNTSIQQRKNRLLLLETAIKAGFANYGYEWWHYSYGDKMYASLTNAKHAKYGLATDKDDPILSIDKEHYLQEMMQRVSLVDHN